MPKTFYTERDIEDMAKQGVTSIVVTDDVVVTDAGREKAPRVGITLLTERQAAAQAAAPSKAAAAAQPKPAAPQAAAPAPIAAPVATADLEARVYNAVKAKLGGQVDDALLRTIVKRVLTSLGR
jgi:chorismate mutase